MKNRDVYLRDPLTWHLKNEGVARVTDDESGAALEILRYELETFVCDGEYEKGMAHILQTFLKGIDRADQPGVWVSGFYGSGKSHFVKMLRALWVDTKFPDGATARGITNLPDHIRDLLLELSTEGVRRKGLHAASGTLGSSARGSVRLALLEIIFGSVGLPKAYHKAKFVFWLQEQGIYEAVRSRVEGHGGDWEYELDNLFVADLLHDALREVKPTLFPSAEATMVNLANQFAPVSDVSNEDMVQAMQQALSKDGEFPLTLVVLDEVQQYIGGNAQLAHDVQEVVETCSKSFSGRLIFVGTGQTGITGQTDLRRLEGRFRVRVELSAADVDTVLRKIVLAKKPAAKEPLDEVFQRNSGEISRHLDNTTLRHRHSDAEIFAQDYPLLPTRRRFWDLALRALDRTGTDSQLRNQLSLVHKVIQTNVDKPLGHVVAADYLFFDAAARLLQTKVLTQGLYEETHKWMASDNEDDQLRARACGLVFLINQLSDSNSEIGIRATVDTVADLLIESLPDSSASLRRRLPDLLDETPLLLKINDEYRIQTEESTAWTDHFMQEKTALRTNQVQVNAERDEQFRTRLQAVVRRVVPKQGTSQKPRTIVPTFGAELPADAAQKLSVWIRTSWEVAEGSVRADARAAGGDSPIVFVYVEPRSIDELNNAITAYKAATIVLEDRGEPEGPDAQEARRAMISRRDNAKKKIDDLFKDAFRNARVLQGGGTEIPGNDLAEMLAEATGHSAQRLYRDFHIADHPKWGDVYNAARAQAPDALKHVGYDGAVQDHPVCKAILAYVGLGKSGADIRNHFEAPSYGWDRDAIDGSLYVLLVTGLMRVQDENGHAVDHTSLNRNAIGKSHFYTETVTISTGQRIEIRKLFQRVGIPVGGAMGDEAKLAEDFVKKLDAITAEAGGDPPMPERPHLPLLGELHAKQGNELLSLLYRHRKELGTFIDECRVTAEKIESRLPLWEQLARLQVHARQLADVAHINKQIDHIRSQRQLLVDPDPVAPLLQELTQRVRDELNRLDRAYENQYAKGMAALAEDGNWTRLDSDTRARLLKQHHLDASARPVIQVSTLTEVLQTLDRIPLSTFADRIHALPNRFGDVLAAAAKLLEPKVQFVRVPRRMLKDKADLEKWVEEVREQIAKTLDKGPVAIN